MKAGSVVSSLILISSILTTQAALVASWDFNSIIPDGAASTGTLQPAFGVGMASLVGKNSGSFATGDTSHDPAGSTDNSCWHTTGYPAADQSDASTGVRFDVDTTGFEAITLSWYERHSATASRYARLQYTLDGSTFVDADVIAIYADSVYTNQTVDLGGIAGAANNPLFGFRIVTQFESSASGGGTNAYVATHTGSSYSTSGTINFDMVTVSGTLMPGANTPPSISIISNQTMRVTRDTGPLAFTISDLEDPAANLVLGKASSNPEVIAESNIVFGGAGSDRTVQVTAGNQTGSSVVTVYVVDTGGRSNHTEFSVTVLPANTAPVISNIPRTNTLVNTSLDSIPFTVGDLETGADELIVSGVSANPTLVPNSPANIHFGGSGSNRTLSLTPALGQTGVAPITVTVSDGTNTAQSTFALVVTPSSSLLLYDCFDYGSGSLVTNSGFLWENRSGTLGECEVVNGQLQVTANQTEDVVAPFPTGICAKSNGIVLYASFKANFRTLPKLSPDYFAHFGQGTYLRGRIYASTTNCWPGGFRLLISNGSDPNPAAMYYILSTNTTYTLVTRYDLDHASTTLWVNPSSESDPGLDATDTQAIVPVAAYGFRQDAGVGATILVDDLKVGLTFADVVSTVVNPIPLNIQCRGGQVVLGWADSAFALQAGPTARGPFTNIIGAVNPYTNQAVGPARFFRLKTN